MNEHVTLTAQETPQRTSVPLPMISVLVPVKNEEAFIEVGLLQLLEQDYPPTLFEVIVADGRSTDRTRELVTRLMQEYQNLQLVDNPGMLSSAGRNAALNSSRGEIVVVVDGHCELDDNKYLQNIADAFQRSGVDCLGRPQPLDVTEATGLQRAIATARASWLGHHSASFIYADQEQLVPPQSVAVAYRREVFEKVGQFDETFDACEDVEFNHRVDRAGLTCLFTPRIRVRYFPRASLRGLFRQLARYGRGRMRLLRKHRDTFSLASIVPACFLAGVILGLVPALLWEPCGRIYGGVLAIYFAAVLAESLRLTFVTKQIELLGWFPCVFVTIHAGSGYGLLREFLAGAFRRQS